MKDKLASAPLRDGKKLEETRHQSFSLTELMDHSVMHEWGFDTLPRYREGRKAIENSSDQLYDFSELISVEYSVEDDEIILNYPTWVPSSLREFSWAKNHSLSGNLALYHPHEVVSREKFIDELDFHEQFGRYEVNISGELWTLYLAGWVD